MKGKDVRNAAIDGILKASLSFIRDGNSSLTALSNREASKKLRHIAGSKHLMNGGKVRGSLFVAEVRSKNTPSDTFSSQELAGSTWRTRACH